MSIPLRRFNEPVHEFQTRRRAEAAYLFETTDLSIAEVARRVGVSRRYVSQWHTSWQRGDTSFMVAQRSGGKDRLTDEQNEEIRQKIMAGPKAAGYEQQLWNQKRIAELVLQETGVSYHPNFIRVLMAAMDITYQKPSLRPKQQSATKIAEFVDTTFPEVKKSP